VAPTRREIPADRVIAHGAGARVRAELGDAPGHTYAEGRAAAAAWWRGR
jgi:hypothetical protein